MEAMYYLLAVPGLKIMGGEEDQRFPYIVTNN